MEHLSKGVRGISLRAGLMALFSLVTLAFVLPAFTENSSDSVRFASMGGWIIFNAIMIGWYAGKLANQPLSALGKAILHASPEANADAPDTDNVKIAKQFVKVMVYNIYQIASMQDNKMLAEHRREATQAANILNHLPLPVFVFNKDQIVTFASESGLNYTGVDSSNLFGKSFFETVDLEFQSGFTLESWIKDCVDNKATDTAYWRRVRVKIKDQEEVAKQCDMAGYYSKDNPKGVEFIVTMFDHSEKYNKDESNMNLIALAVHELRTPLTAMRGYIEALQEDLQGKLVGDSAVFMSRAASSLKQLSSFVNNILNMAKINENQLSLKLSEEKWTDIINHVADDMGIRAQALKKQINLNIPADIPTVGADRTTIYEVLTNLIDNALKYSGESTNISINVELTKDNLVETVVEDKGVGIPTTVMPTLFEKFHRNHRNKDNISGTGLGLYISRAIVTAHGGDIWVKSKEGEGTRVGFTLKPYSTLAEDDKNGNNSMTRTAHGWIKNHSLYRR